MFPKSAFLYIYNNGLLLNCAKKQKNVFRIYLYVTKSPEIDHTPRSVASDQNLFFLRPHKPGFPDDVTNNCGNSFTFQLHVSQKRVRVRNSINRLTD